ncbi:Di-/tripeptide transporter [Minicystis rosea]|nr:Di-/tripeptide transporter [Minicystis rosea]
MEADPAITTDTSGMAGHPKGLMTLFFTEMWERFSYYGMRAFLMLFMVAPVAAGGLGLSDVTAGVIYGMYTSMVYLLSVPGGWVADRFLGQQNAVLYGGILIMAGHISLAVPSGATFYVGLALVALGTGLLKPNISSIVGQLYAPGDTRRDAGFTIFYMGINIGAFLAPLVCGAFLAESETFRRFLHNMGIEPQAAWHFAFGAAAVGMFLGIVQYALGRRNLRDAGAHPTPPKDAVESARNKRILGALVTVFLLIPLLIGVLAVAGKITLTPESVGSVFDILMPATAVAVLLGLFFFGAADGAERRRMMVIIILFFAAAVFWGCFEQAGSTLTLFAKRHTNRTVFGHPFGATVYQSLNSLFVVLLAPLFAWLWIALARRNREPSTTVKFALGMFGVGLGFLILVPAARIVLGGSLAGPGWLVALYLVHTCGELCLSPVGLSAMTKLAPTRIVGLIMGVWFLAASLGNYLAGRAVGVTQMMSMDGFFLLMTAFPVTIGVILLLLAKPVKRMLGGLDASPATPGH